MMSSLRNNLKNVLMPLLLCSGIFASAQTEKEVMKPIHQLFEGIKEADSLKVHRTFLYEATMFTSYTNNDGAEILQEVDMEEFISAIAKKPKEGPKWIEKLYNTEVKIDGNIAQVWAEYTFFVGDQLSHCGVNAFQLVKTNGTWKILQIVDTRRKEGCNQD